MGCVVHNLTPFQNAIGTSKSFNIVKLVSIIMLPKFWYQSLRSKLKYGENYNGWRTSNKIFGGDL